MMTAHQWKTQRQGGHPADATSYERVCFCEVCGLELTEDNQDSECDPLRDKRPTSPTPRSPDMAREPVDIDTDLALRFDHHPPPNSQVANAHARMRDAMKLAAESVHLLVPPGRENALALTKLEEAMLWANAGIARAPYPLGRSDDGTLIATNEQDESG